MLAARRIKFKAERTKQDLLDIGKELTEVKARLSHGQFGEWLAVEFDMSERSAQRFMSAYETYGAKSDTVSLLSDSALYLLSGPSVPEEAREQVEDETRTAGRSPTKTRVQEIIASHRPPPPPPPPFEMPQGLAMLDDAAPTGRPIAIAGDTIEDTGSHAELVDLVTMEAHIWRIALLEVGHNLAHLHQWITEHDQPGPYGRIACAQPHTFHEAYSAVQQEIAAKYDYRADPLPLPPTAEPTPPAPTNANELHNWRINQISAALDRIQQMDFEHYSNMTSDWTSPRQLRDITTAMIHKLEGNIR